MKRKSTRDLSEEESGPIGRAVRTFFLQPLKDDEGHRVPHFDALNYFCFALVMTAFAVAIWYFRSQTNLSIISVNTFDGLSKCIDTPLFNAEYKGQFITSFFADEDPDVTLFDLNFGRFRFSPEYQVSWTIRFSPLQPQWQDPSNVNRMQDLLRRAPFNVSASSVRNSTDWVQRIVQYVRNEPSPFGTLHSAQVYYSIQPRFINHGVSLLMSFETFPNCSGVLETSNYRLPFFTAEYQRMALVNYNCANYGEQFNSSYFSGTETPCGPCNQTLNNSADYAYLLEKMAPFAIAALYEQVLPRLCLTSDPLPVLQVLSLAISVTALFLAFVRLVLVPAGSSLLRGLFDKPAEAELSADREDARYLPLRAPDQANESGRGQQ